MFKIFLFIMSIIILTTNPVYAIEFNCSDLTKDCSTEFKAAIKQAAASSNKTLTLKANTTYKLFDVRNYNRDVNNSLDGLTIDGNGAKVFTDRFEIKRTNNLTIRNITFSGNTGNGSLSASYYGSVLKVGDTYSDGQSTNGVWFKNITIDNVTITDGLYDLLHAHYVDGLVVKNSHFSRSGRSKAVFSDGRPYGIGVYAISSKNSNIYNNTFSEVPRLGMMISGVQNDVTIKNNQFNGFNPDFATNKYGNMSGHGIYMSGHDYFDNVRIEDNEFKNFYVNAIRANGYNVVISNNYINKNMGSRCTERDNNVPSNYYWNNSRNTKLQRGIWIHGATNMSVFNNCIHNVEFGILAASEGPDVNPYRGPLNNNLIKDNVLVDLDEGISFKYAAERNRIENNRIYGTVRYAIDFHSKLQGNQNLGKGNDIVGNSITNGNPNWSNPQSSAEYTLRPFAKNPVRVRNQYDLHYDNNWIFGQVNSDYNHVLFVNTDDSWIRNFTVEAITGGNLEGIKLDSSSSGNTLDSIRTKRLNPGIVDEGTNNTVTNHTTL